GLDIPVSIDLDKITVLSDSALALVEVKGNATIPVPFQVKQGERRELTWPVTNNGHLSGKRVYQLVHAADRSLSGSMSVYDKEGTLTIHAGDQNLLRYYYKTLYPPDGIDTNYKRSGFIHPLWTPRGQELTRIQAPDHYHHYGIWNPWTHVLFESDTVDFWNIKGRKGTVRFAKMIAIASGEIFSEFEVLHEHVVFKKDGSEKVALNEVQTVRVYKPEGDKEYYLVDITSRLSCASASPFLILAYRYAGLGWRTTGFWDNNNCEVLTSEGKTRANTDNSRARWCIVQGALPDNEYGGAVMLSYPANYNHPEPMRIWTLDTNGRGDMFANFAPTRDRDWLLVPGNTYVLRYRFVVFNGKFDKAKAESAWHYFATPPEITIKQ
ncbi:MAG: PmoA family protein, partial [Chitinophagaceae bacterium]